MKLPLYQVDAFADKVFSGNPAAVVPLERWLPEDVLQSIAEENNLSETAFFVREKFNIYHLRWFTPVHEVDLCGHATLATAHTLYACLGYELPEIQFETRSGRLTVYKESDGYFMDFPSDLPRPKEFPGIEQVLGCEIKNTALGVSDILVEVENQEIIEGLSPDFRAMMNFDVRGVIVTAPGREEDIVSRCFFPSYGIDEDPVTGSAHTTLFSYWGTIWGKNKMTARQLSARQGFMHGELRGNRVWLKGNAVLYLEGQIYIPE